jgi:hypothetical protein
MDCNLLVNNTKLIVRRKVTVEVNWKEVTPARINAASKCLKASDVAKSVYGIEGTGK